MTISGRISSYQKRITHQKSRKPLCKTHERLKNRPFRQYKNHLQIKFFLSIDGRLSGGDGGIRTPDPLVANEVLSH
jgi:hypothetical protein